MTLAKKLLKNEKSQKISIIYSTFTYRENAGHTIIYIINQY